MLASFVNRRAFPVLLGAARTDRAFNLVTNDPLNAISDGFIRLQLVAHDSWPRHLRASATLLYFGFPVTSRPLQSGGSNAAQFLWLSNSTSATTRPSCRPR